jgi:hypothetical protein
MFQEGIAKISTFFRFSTRSGKIIFLILSTFKLPYFTAKKNVVLRCAEELFSKASAKIIIKFQFASILLFFLNLFHVLSAQPFIYQAKPLALRNCDV